MIDTQNETQPENLGEGSEADSSIRITSEGKVTDKDIFRLAIGILLFCSAFYAVLIYFRLCYDSNGSKEVWEHGKVFLSSTITLILGLYFGKKSS
jgi:hypothetical protein